MTIYGWIFRWFGWAIGLGLLTGALTYYRDGHVDWLTQLAGLGILIWWGWSWYREIQAKRSIERNMSNIHTELLLRQYLENQQSQIAAPPTSTPKPDLGVKEVLHQAEDERQLEMAQDPQVVFADMERKSSFGTISFILLLVGSTILGAVASALVVNNYGNLDVSVDRQPTTIPTQVAEQNISPPTSPKLIVPSSIPSTTIPVIPEFKIDEVDGRGLRYDPCDGPITIAINFGTVSTSTFNNATTWVINAAADVSRESGLEFIFTGATDKVPQDEYRDGRNGPATILIGLLKPGESGATLIKKGESWGLEWSRSIGHKTPNSEWLPIEAYDHQINADYSITETDIRRALLGAIGLDMVHKKRYSGSEELMSVVTSADNNSFEWVKENSAWGPGDILGMQAVGAINGCIG